MIIITNFNVSKQLGDVKYDYDNNKYSNINTIINDFKTGHTTWSVLKNSAPGDVVIFMCAKEARHNLGMATSHIPANYSKAFKTWIDGQKSLYKQYSGYLLGYGVIDSIPQQDGNWWMADINQLQQFPVPIHIDDFRSFITIARTNSITKIDDTQGERLKWQINQKNPGFFLNVVTPELGVVNQEFEEAVKKESKKTIKKLEQDAKKKASQPTTSNVQTKVYHRDPTIAAYVKKRANGHCQLCGKQAPFNDSDGEPYLECHHIDWLSKGGMDSIDNCVALCPNCHRKMHVLNDPNDIALLKRRISD